MQTTEENNNTINQLMPKPVMNNPAHILEIGIQRDANTLSVKNNPFANVLKHIKENNQQYTSIFVENYINDSMLEDLKESLKLNTNIGYIDWGINKSNTLIQEINAIVKANVCVHQYYAKDLEHALMSLHIYKEGKKDDVPSLTQSDLNQDEKQDELDAYNKILSQWKIEQIFDFPGGYAAIYKNNHKAILVYRGLSFKFKDLIQNNSSTKGAIQGGIRSQIISQHEQIYQIMSEISSRYQNKYLSVTGYGFGGWLAEVSIFLAMKDLGYDARRLKCVSFESFGSEGVFEKFKSNIQNKYTKFDPSDLDVTIYLSIPNPLNSMNKHIGNVYSLATTSKSKAVSGAASVVDKIKSLKTFIGKIYKISNNFVEGRVLGLSAVFAVNMVDILEVFDIESGFVKGENIGIVKDWPHINFKPPKKGICTHVSQAFSKVIPCGDKIAKVAASGLSKGIDFLVGERTISNIISIIHDLIFGDTDSSQYWKVFENMEIVNGKYQVRGDTNIFGMKFEGHYDVVEFLMNEDILSKQNQKGHIEWYLCMLQKNSKLIEESNNITPHQKLIIKDIISSYEIDERCKKIKLLPRSDFKTVQNLKDYLTRLLDINPVLKEIADGQVIVEYIQQEVNENKRKISQINKVIKNTVSIDDLSMNIPIPRDKNIIEKIDVYNQIDKLFEKEQVVILKGFGGLGKSTCAAMYGRNKEKEAYKVIWFYAEDGLDNDYEWLCNMINLDMRGKGAADKREQIEIRLKKSKNKFLFIFDNANKLEDIQSYIINLPDNVKVIVTTRQDIDQFSTIDLNEFSQNEAIAYLNNVLKGKKYTEKDLLELINTVGKLPLRLALSGAYLALNKLTTVTKYIEKYDQFSQMLNIKLHTGKNDQAQAITSILSLETLQSNELMMMEYASYLNPDFIQLEIFKELGFSEDSIQEIIKKLSELSLLRYLEQEEAFMIHRLVQNETRLFIQSDQLKINDLKDQQDKKQQNVVGQIALALNSLFPYLLLQEGYFQIVKKANIYIYHVEYLLSFKNDQFDVNLAKLFDKKAVYTAFVLREFDRAIDEWKKGIDILKKIYKNSNHEDVAISLFSIGLILFLKNDTDDSIKYLNQSLDMRKQLFGEKHATVADTLQQLSLVYLVQGQYDNSIKCLNESLYIIKQVFGEKHVKNTVILNQLGKIYLQKEEYNNSIKYFNELLDISKELGERKYVGIALNNLGQSYQQIGKFDLSIKYKKEGLDIVKQELGEKDIEVAIILQGIGITYFSQREYDLSMKYLLKSLDVFKEQSGESFPFFGEIHKCLGLTYYKKGEYDNATKHINEYQDMRKKNQEGDDSYVNYILMQIQKNKYNDNSRINESLEIRKETQEEKPAEVAASLSNIDLTCQQKADCDNSIIHLNESLDITQQVL
ncbi:hypothetical protein ABPG72_000760 [Tetrahymena utriculariae]